MEKKFREPSCCRKCKLKGDGVNCMGCKKPLRSKLYFKCEICDCVTPKECEGSYPNTCAMCMPLANNDKERYNGYNQRY